MEIEIKFALKPKLTVNELRRAFDECNLLIPPSLTKNNKSDPADTDPLQSEDDGTPRHQIGTTTHKHFNNVEFKVKLHITTTMTNCVDFHTLAVTRNKCGTIKSKSPPQHQKSQES